MLYIMYIDYMRVIAPVPWADDEVVGEWRIDGVSEFSKIFKLRGNKSVNPSWCSFLVISFPDINVRRRQVSLTVSASKQREQFQVCAAKLDLSDFSIDPAFKLHTVRLNGTQGIGSVLEVGMHTASQPRWMHGQQVIPRSTASFVKPQADAQAQLLHSHVLEQTANAATLASAEDVSSGGGSVEALEGVWESEEDKDSKLVPSTLEISTDAEPKTVALREFLREASPDSNSYYPGARIRIQGLCHQPEMNGYEGVLLEYDASELRWRVRLSNGAGKLIKPCNLAHVKSTAGISFVPKHSSDRWDYNLLRVGTRVFLKGLTQHPHLNGATATLIDFDVAERRWKVHVDDGGLKLLRPQNLVPSASLQAQPANDRKNGLEHPSQELGRYQRPGKLEGQQELSPRWRSDMLSPGQRVCISGLQNRSDLNRLRGTVAGWDATRRKYLVYLEDNSRRAFLPEHVEPLRADAADGMDDKAGVARASTAVVPGQSVRIVAMQQRPELNEQEAVVEAWDEQHGRWRVRMRDGCRKAFFARNLLPCVAKTGIRADRAWSSTFSREEFSVGQRVRVSGLQNRPDLVGQEGTIVMQDASNQRWRVRMDSGSGRVFDAAHLQSCELTTR